MIIKRICYQGLLIKNPNKIKIGINNNQLYLDNNLQTIIEKQFKHVYLDNTITIIEKCYNYNNNLILLYFKISFQ